MQPYANSCVAARPDMLPPLPPSHPQEMLTKDKGGHETGVHTLVAQGNFLFSGDRQGHIKVGAAAAPAASSTSPAAAALALLAHLLAGRCCHSPCTCSTVTACSTANAWPT